MPGAILVGAAVVMVTGAAIGFLAPSLRDAPPFVTEDVASVAAAIAGNPAAWMWANGLILVAAVVTALGLVPISLRFQGRGRPWAMVALVAFVFAAVFESLDRMISIQVTTWAAQHYPDPTVFQVFEAFDRFDTALGTAFTILAFLAIGLYGVAMSRSPGDGGLGWLFVGIGVVGVLLEVGGAAIPAFVFFATAGFGAVSLRRNPRPPLLADPLED